MEENLFNNLKDKVIRFFEHREYVLITVFVLLFSVIVVQCFQLQIINGQQYQDKYALSIQKTREVSGTRGNIYDRNGTLIAYNKLAYTITIEDNGDYDTMSQKNESINEVIKKVIHIVEKNHDSVINNFGIIVNDQLEYEFVKPEGTSRLRFIADVYGLAYVDDLTEEQRNATAEEIIVQLCTDEKTGYGLDITKLSKTDVLKYVNIRYAMGLNSYRKYIPTTIAVNVSEETLAEIMERSNELQGVNIAEDSERRYIDSIYFAPIIGYTGKISEDEYQKYHDDGYENYTKNDIVGKTGLEQHLDPYLQGTKGEEKIYANNVGKIIESVNVKPASAGNDVYLTIDSELQKVAYDVLEEKLAGILLANIQNIMTYDPHTAKDASEIVIPIGDVYNAFFGNEILDVRQFSEEDAGPTEKAVLAIYEDKLTQVMEKVLDYVQDKDGLAYKELNKEQQAYLSYIVNDLLKNTAEILDVSVMDTEDPVYIAWAKDETININTFLHHAISQNWINTNKLKNHLKTDSDYTNSSETFSALVAYLEERLSYDRGFQKLIYRDLVIDKEITGTQIAMLAYEQEILDYDKDAYEKLKNGTTNSYQFMLDKIKKLEITPGQLGLEPCSGSIVITDPNNGDVLAMVSYPGYDNNRLANELDTQYFNKLVTDTASPFYNHATLEKTAPGSTFKMVSMAAGIGEGVIQSDTVLYCDGEFNKVFPHPKCWIYPYEHGHESPVTAIQDSCNNYFYEIGYRLGIEDRKLIGTDNEEGSTTSKHYSSDLGTTTLAKYAEMFGLGEKSGIEIAEAEPEISDTASVPSAIGQGTHNYTTSQLTRYISAVANKGSLYDLTLVDRVEDVNKTVVKDFSQEPESKIALPSSVWTVAHQGMEQVVKHNDAFDSMEDSISLAGKTGTAQQSKINPDHALFVGFTPVNNPKYSFGIRIANGYSSSYAAEVGRELTRYISGTVEKEDIVTGNAASITESTSGD